MSSLELRVYGDEELVPKRFYGRLRLYKRNGLAKHGEMAERFKAAVLKTVERKLRGFESLSLRHTMRKRLNGLKSLSG